MKKVIKKRNVILLIINYLYRIQKKILGQRDKLNNWMNQKNSPHLFGLLAAVAVSVLWILMLMIPPYMGVADDGSLQKVMERSGLSYIQKDSESIYNNFYIRVYSVENIDNKGREISNSQDILIHTALWLDEIITHDRLFDMRFLALLYGILYFPAIYYFVKNACMLVANFSETVLISILSVVIFGDLSFLTYFSSLYPEPLWLICILILAGQVCNMVRKKGGYIELLLVALAGVVISMSRQQCGVIAFFVAGFLIRSIFFNKKILWRTSCILLIFILDIVGMISLYSLESDYSITSKYHSMTRGVLFQASDPEKALSEFGINSSYSILTNVSAYDYYPYVLPDNAQLQKNFYDNYSTGDIVVYYIKNPYSFIKMLDIVIKNVTNLQRSYCGNYEQSYGMPKMAQGIFWSGWSIFKTRSMPKTIGYLVLLVILAFYVAGRNRRREQTSSQQLLSLTYLMMAIGISQAAITIVMSGDAEITRHAFLMGLSMDILLYYSIVSTLSRLKLFEDDVDEKEKRQS